MQSMLLFVLSFPYEFIVRPKIFQAPKTQFSPNGFTRNEQWNENVARCS